jgi:tetratricopeptide (TPR) repeat protein
VSIDPRHAELQYRYGQTLLALGRFDEAEKALVNARDEDVCPLRALTPMMNIVAEVAREQGIDLVDYNQLLRQRMQNRHGHPILGQEDFLDHVHTTAEDYGVLALALIQSMIEQGIVQPDKGWDDQAIMAVSARIENQIDNEAKGNALNTLARVLLWAGKQEDASRLARKAQEIAGDKRQVAVDSASILSSVYVQQKQFEEAVKLLYATLEFAPGAIEVRLKLGENLVEPQIMQLEEAAANFLLVCQQMPSYDRGYELYGYAMAKRGRLEIAYASLMEALRLNPNNNYAKATLARVRQAMGTYTPNLQPTQLVLNLYPSQAPHTLAQVSRDASGRFVTDGIEVEFYENGRLKYFADIAQGQLNGFEMTWGPDGKLLSKQAYQNGTPMDVVPES